MNITRENLSINTFHYKDNSEGHTNMIVKAPGYDQAVQSILLLLLSKKTACHNNYTGMVAKSVQQFTDYKV